MKMDVPVLAITFLGFVGTIALLILNLKVQSSVDQMRAEFLTDLSKAELRIAKDVSELELQVAQARIETLKEHAALREQIMGDVVSKNESHVQHQANTERLATLEQNLKALVQRVSDIS
jgi:hypothetical protein